MTFSGIQQDTEVKNTPIKSSIHETFIEKDFVYENEEEGNKEKPFADLSTSPEETIYFISDLSDHQRKDNSVHSVSLHILYCVFLI